MTDDNKAAENTVEAADDDSDFTLGQFREKTKDLPDSTPIVINAIIPTYDEDDDSSSDTDTSSDNSTDAVESADDDSEDDEGDEVVTAPVLGVEIEDYTNESENGVAPTTVKAIAIVMHIDDVIGDDDEEEDDEPVDNA